jgi:hypothetical protein
LRSLVTINDKIREEKLNETKNELKKEFEQQINELKIYIQELLKDNAKKDMTNANNEVEIDDQQIDEK